MPYVTAEANARGCTRHRIRATRGAVALTPYLALAEGALCAALHPGGAAESHQAVFVGAGPGDVVADSVGLAGVRHTARAALPLGDDGEVTVDRWAGQGPAVHLALLRAGQRQTGLRSWLMHQTGLHTAMPIASLLWVREPPPHSRFPPPAVNAATALIVFHLTFR